MEHLTIEYFGGTSTLQALPNCSRFLKDVLYVIDNDITASPIVGNGSCITVNSFNIENTFCVTAVVTQMQSTGDANDCLLHHAS